MVIFGTKRIGELEGEKNTLQTRLDEAEEANRRITTQYETLQGEYLALQTTLGEQKERVSGLEVTTSTARDRIIELETRLTELPNREITTLKAIHDLASARSNEGYDAFLKDMIRSMIDEGITAYEDTLHPLLRGVGPKRRDQGENSMFRELMINEESVGYYIGFNVLDVVTRPTVNFIGFNFPYLEEKDGSDDDPNSTKGIIKKHYGNSQPHVRLEFRNKQHAGWCRSRQEEIDMLNNLTPEEWQKRLEVDKEILLKAFGFGFIASYYEDVRANPGLPTVLNNAYTVEPRNIPTTLLQMQERTGLTGSQWLLQDLYECIQGANPKFGADVLGYFKGPE